MAKKKATKKVARKRKVARKARKPARKAVKKAARKTGKKVARKKVVKKVAKAKRARPVAKVARKLTKKAKRAVAATKPKLPRRTKQALPPKLRPTPAPVVEVEPLVATPPPPPLSVSQPAFAFGEVVEAETTPAQTTPAAPPHGPDAGAPAPDFTLPDETGRMHSLSQYRGQKVVVYFYPKDDTPGCTTEACSFRDALGSFTDHDTVVLGISPDNVASHQRFVQKYGLTFPLLADEGHAVAERYGVWVEKLRHGEASMGIARTTFIIGPDGRILHVFRNVRPEGHEQEVLRQLAAL